MNLKFWLQTSANIVNFCSKSQHFASLGEEIPAAEKSTWKTADKLEEAKALDAELNSPAEQDECEKKEEQAALAELKYVFWI